jgi:DNA polymerase-3 subunit beta
MTITEEITVRPQPFAAAVAWVAKWVSTRPTVPIQGGIAMVLEPNYPDSLQLVAFSENATVRAQVPIEGIHAGGTQRAIVSGRLLAELAATFDGSKPVTISTNTIGHVALSVGRWTGTMPTFDENEWPTLPAMMPTIGAVVGDDLARAVARVGVANLKDESKTGVFRLMYLGFDTDLTVLATDRWRVARTKVAWRPGTRSRVCSATPFGTVLIDAAAAFAGPDIVTVGLDGQMMSFTSPTRSLSMRLGDPGENGWPVAVMEQNIALADGYGGTATLSPAEVAMPLKRASIVRGKEGPVKLALAAGTLTIASSEAELHQDGNEEVDVRYDGPAASVAFNPRYLAEALASVPGDEVEMQFEVADFTRHPVVLRAKDDPDWRHVIVPVVIHG